MELCVGIDLGTTNSVLAVVNEKPNGDLVSKVVDLSRAVDSYAVPGGSKYMYQKKPLLPSYVYYRPESEYSSIVGDYAKGMYAKRPHLVVKSIKSQMGNAVAEGMVAEIPDKTPARISSRILMHMLNQASKIYHQDIRDAVITVPANFDAAMCKATLEAAAMAGVIVRRPNGTEKPILLSEPNAVMYDLINQIRNGEVHASILDLSEPRQVMVFDIGGGTLDITLHTIKWRDEAKSLLKVDEIATNRYTLLGGDDFDEVIAKEMFNRYLAKYEDSPAAVEAIRKEQTSVMAQLRIFAEGLKLELSNRKLEAELGDSAWGWDDEEEEGFAVGGHMGSTGFAYDDYFTTEEIEGFLEPFMGRDLVLDDYKRLSAIKETNTIVYPILDVLHKAAAKLGDDQVRVDAVVLNGGMSKFYMVQQRLKAFFGFDPIVALDPDQAVARGAAIYHHYLRINEALLQDDMRLVGDEAAATVEAISKTKGTGAGVATNDEAGTGGGAQGRHVVDLRDFRPNTFGDAAQYGSSGGSSAADALATAKALAAAKRKKLADQVHIQFGKTVLNEGLYLGLKNGVAPVELVPTGAELPFVSQVMKGFKIRSEQERICIPIQTKTIDGTMQTIAKGNIKVHRVLKEEAYVAFVVSMSSSKVLTMKAWITSDVEGQNAVQSATVMIEIGREKNPIKAKERMLPPNGSLLRADYEINSLIQLCRNWEKYKNPNNTSAVKALTKIRSITKGIRACRNPQDFGRPMLEALMTEMSQHARLRLYGLIRRICTHWTEQEQRQLADACMSELALELLGIHEAKGARVNTLNAAIMTLAKCGSDAQIVSLGKIQDPKLRQGMMYTLALRQENPDWLYQQFVADAHAYLQGKPKSIQESARSLGLALSQYNGRCAPFDHVSEALTLYLRLCRYESHVMTDVTRCTCISALGWICDQRTETARAIDSLLLHEVRDVLQVWNVEGTPYQKCCLVAEKMINGLTLDESDEKYLLSLVEAMETD